MIASALNHLWHVASRPAAARFAAALADPGRVQRARLRALVRMHAASAFGRRHGFSGLTSAADFRRAVPVQDWNDVASWVERIRQGETQVLTVDPCVRLVPTGGSSGGVKLIPWTHGLGREFSAGIAAWLCDLHRRFPGARGGRAYWSVTPATGAMNQTDSRIPVGFEDDSAYVGGIWSWCVRRTFAVPTMVRELDDLEAFRHVTALRLLACDDLRVVSVWHPSFLAHVLDTMVERRDGLLRDLATGGAGGLPSALARRLAPWFRPQPERARRLAAVDWHDPRALWPHLAVVSCWGDAAAAVPCAALQRRFGEVPVQRKGLLATEGMVSIPWGGATVAAVTGPVLEFIDHAGAARWIDELEIGGVYDVVMTTAGGLWRYRLGDRVMVTGFVQRTPCLRFLGRMAAVCDMVGEKLEDAFVAACLASVLGADVFALLSPDAANGDGPAGYTVRCTVPVGAAMLERLDHVLAANPAWRWARAIGQLRPLRYLPLAATAADAWLIYRAQRAGVPLGAVKPTAIERDAACLAHLDEQVERRHVV